MPELDIQLDGAPGLEGDNTDGTKQGEANGEEGPTLNHTENSIEEVGSLNLTEQMASTQSLASNKSLPVEVILTEPVVRVPSILRKSPDSKPDVKV